MYLGKIGYYADFVIYPVLLLACTSFMLWHAGQMDRFQWLLAAAFGLALWTLLEYAMHRIVLHRVAYFERMHDVHHKAPTAKIGTPSWASLSIAVFGILMPSVLLLGGFLGSGLTIGILVGYLWYICVHHAVHHWRPRHGSYLYRAKIRHSRHHFADHHSNYGVTTAIWDGALRSRADLAAKAL